MELLLVYSDYKSIIIIAKIELLLVYNDYNSIIVIALMIYLGVVGQSFHSLLECELVYGCILRYIEMVTLLLIWRK
jgi:hypothetical protein